jgi:maltose-binding protein MalE
LKKFLLIFVILITIIAFATQINVWVSWEGINYYKTIARNYESSHPGVNVNVTFIPDMKKKIFLISNSPKELPDAFMARGANISTYMAMFKKKLLRVDKSNSPLDKVFDDYAFPLYADIQVIYVNKDIVKDKINLNYTMDDLINIASKYKYGLCLDLTSSWVFAGILSGRKNLADQSGNIVVNDKITENTIKYLLEMKKQGIFTTLARRTFVPKFKLGQLPFIVQGNFLMKSFENLGFKVEILPFPKEGSKYQTFKPLIDAKGMVVTSREGLEFTKYLQKSEELEKLCTNYYKVNYLGKSDIKALEISLQRGVYEPHSKKYAKGYFKAMRNALLLIINSGEDVEKALNDAQAYINNVN